MTVQNFCKTNPFPLHFKTKNIQCEYKESVVERKKHSIFIIWSTCLGWLKWILKIKKRSMVLVLFHIYIYMQWSKSAAITRHWPDCHKLPSNQVLPCMVQCLEIIFSFFFYQHRMRNKTKTRGTWYTGRKVLSSTDSSKYVSSHIHVLQLFISKRTLLMVWEQLYNGFFFQSPLNKHEQWLYEKLQPGIIIQNIQNIKHPYSTFQFQHSINTWGLQQSLENSS